MGWGSGNLGGSTNVWAVIIVTYPAGSTLTATNVAGKKDITSTQRLYYVKKPSSGTTQSCEFTISNSTTGQTKSYTVSDITIGTAEMITMLYEIVLFENGVLNPLLNTPTGYSLTVQGNYIVADCEDATGKTAFDYYASDLDLSLFSTLEITVYKYRGHGDYKFKAGLCSGTTYSTMLAEGTLQNSSTQGAYVYPSEPLTVNISDYSTGHLFFYLTSRNWPADAYISKIRLY